AKIIDPQSAVLTNIEVLAYLTANPPRLPPSGPPNSRNWVPSPDLRDHNTVVKEVHNYVSRISPHLLKYPRYAARPSSQSQTQADMTGTLTANGGEEAGTSSIPPPPSSEPTPMDKAIRELIMRLHPYGLTKAEVLMIINLGVGLRAGGDAETEGNGDGAMDVDHHESLTNGDAGEENGEGEEEGDDDTGALALLNTIVEELDSRIPEDQIPEILAIVREVLSENYEG
ncbi:hypothetical protein N7492_008726, partial [Penicillium capsulatum]